MYRILFDDRFAAAVESGAKTRTIRRQRDDLPKPGDRLELLGQLPGVPGCYQLTKALPVCTAVRPIRIYRDRPTWIAVQLDGQYLILSQIRILALAEGFPRTMDFLGYFERCKGLPFEGALIEWALPGAVTHRPPNSLCPLTGCRDNCQTCAHIHGR